MEEIIITEQELEYFTTTSDVVCEESPSLKPQMSFEDEAKDCITLEEFSRMWEESINRLIPKT